MVQIDVPKNVVNVAENDNQQVWEGNEDQVDEPSKVVDVLPPVMDLLQVLLIISWDL